MIISIYKTSDYLDNNTLMLCSSFYLWCFFFGTFIVSRACIKI